MKIFQNDQRFYFGEVTFPPGGWGAARIQPDLQLVTFYSGEANITVDDRSYRVGAGEITILHPRGREIYLYSKKTRTRYSWCTARLPVFSDDVLKLLKQCPLTFPRNSRIEKILRFGLEAQRYYACHRHLVVDHLAQTLFYEYFAATGVLTGEENLPNSNVEKAMQFIGNNLHRHLSGKAIADSVGMSYQHLAQLFRNEFGSTPMKMLWKIRIEKGADLLSSTRLSVDEIASQLGFQNPFHFSRCIKKHFNSSPIELRETFLLAKL